MYFWRIAALKAQLRRGELPERAAFEYTLATMLLCTFVTGPELAAVGAAPGWNWLATAVGLAIVGGGTAAAYRANGGAGGRAFLPRYVALGWVVGVRVFAFLLFPLAALYVALAPDPAAGGGAPLAELVCQVVAGLGFYWRLAVHMRSLAAGATDAASLPPGPGAGAASIV